MHLLYSSTHGHLEELQGKLLTASTGTEYASILELFSDQFISAFTGHSSSSNGILEEVIGHPTLLIQHMTEKFLSFIMVDAAGETASSAAPLSSYLSLSSKNTGHSKLEGSVLLHVPALAYVDGLTAASESMGTLLRVTHILAVLCKWQHNREVVIAKCSTGSNTLATACISGLWSMLDSIDGLISAWYGLGDDAANQVSQLYLHCNAVMTFGLASMLILIRMCGTGDAVPLCGLLPTVPWDAQDMLRCGLDLFAGRSSSSSTSSPSSMNLARAASSPPTSPKARVNNSRLVSPLMDRAMDKVHADVLQLMVTTTLKLDRLSTVSEAAWRGGGAAMSTHDHCYHDQQVQRRQCSTLQLSLQVHALYAVHSCLTASPVTVKVFNAADGPVALGSMLALPSPMDQDDRSIDSVHVELIVQRMCSALRCQESILDATFALTKSVSNSCSMQLEESIHCLRPVLLWLCHRADEEGVQHSLDFSEEVLAGMYVECKSPQILQTTLPPTDLFPWHNATGPPSSNATTTSSSSTSSFLSGMINGAFRESSCYSLTNVFKAYWLERCHNDPSSSSCVLPFEPSKTVLYSLVGDSDAASGRTFRLPKDSSRPGAAFFAEYFKDLPTGRMVDCVLSLLYSLSWKYSEKAYSLQDPMVFFKASLRVMVQVLDLLHQGQTTTTRSSSGSSSSIHASSGHQMFLMHTIFFLSRCTKYNPQKTIQTCRALKLWRALLVYSRISQSRAAVAQSPSLNQFLSVVSFDNLSTSDDDDYNGKVPLDAPAYHLIWSYSLSSDDRSESPVTTMTPMALTPIRSTIDYLSAASVSAHELDTSLLTYGGDEESELFRSRTHSLNDPTALFGSLAPFSSHSHSPPSQHHDSTDHPHHHFSNLDSMVNDDASYSTIELPLDVSGISLSGVADDQQAYKHISDDAKGTMHSYKQEYLQFLVRFVVKDMVMELLRICSHFSYLVHALVDTTFDNSLSLDFEAVELVEILSSGSSDESMIVVIRWLNDLADFHNHLSIHSHLWTSAAKKCLGLSKSLLDSLNDFASSIANDSGMILESRPLFWSVRAAAIQLIGKIVYSTCSKDWIDTFIPNIDSALSANSSLVQRPVRHTVIIRLILDPLCRDFAIAIIIKVLQRCAEILFGLPKHAVQSSSSSKMISQQTMLEALAHDIIKCLLNTLINAPSQPKSNDSSGAVIMSLHALIVLLRNPSALTWNKDSRVSSSAAAIYQGLFTNYGPMTPNHSIFGWTYSRYNIFRDLLASLNATFKKSSSTWDAGRKTSVLNYSLALMCALLADNDTHKEVFRSLMMQRTKRKSSNVAAASSSPSSNTYHDLISMMVTCCDGSTVTDETICIIIEMLLDGFSVEVRRQLAGGVFFPGFDPIPRMRNLIAVPLLLNIAYFCSPEMQCYVIDLLYLLIGGSGSNSLINLSKSLQLQQPSLFELLLDVFPVLSVPAQASAVKILKLLGRNTVNVAQLKRLFRLLHLKDGERPAYSWNLLDAMEGMIVPSTVPRYYFFFQGNDSGLRLPGFKKWPATKGFSFSTWFCVDNPLVVVSSYSSSSSSSSSHSKGREAAAATATTPKYRPTLLCFRQESGVGIELSLSPMVVDKEDSFLIKYSVFSTNNAVASVDVGIVSKSKLNAEGWHHLAFSHSASSFRAKSELTVVLDNKPAEHHFISFPRFTDEIKAPTIGDVAPSFRDEATKMMMMTGFFGQVATIYFFSDPLQAAYLHGIYELGPAYSQLFIDKDVNQQQHGYDSSTTAPADNRPISSSYKVHDGYLSSTIMLTYNAGVRKGNMIIDNTPEKNNNLWRQNRGADAVDPSADERDQDLQVAAAAAAAAAVESDNRRRMQAYRLKGTHICSTRDIRDSFDCLGGVKILLPLFNQLLSGSSASADESALSEHQQLYCKIVRLYFCFLRPTLENYRTINMFGFGLLADFMDTLGPRFLSLDLLTELTSRCDSLSWNESWQNSCVSEILCNFKLWSFSGFEVQRALCDYLHAFADRSVDRFHKVVKVSLFFDALAIFYSSSSLSQDGPSSSSAAAAAAARGILSKRQSTGLNKFKPGGEYWMVSPDWKRFHSLDAGQLDAIRGRITGIIFFVMTSTSDSIEDDVDKMIKFILMEPNPSHKVSMLKTLIAMLNTDRDEIGNKILVTLSMRSSSASFFIQLAAEAEPKVRLYSLIGLCSMVRLALQHGKVSGVPVAWVDSMRGAGAGASASAASDYSKQDDASIGTTEGTETSSSAFPSFAMTRAGSSKFNFAHKSDHSMSSFNHHAEHDANNDPTSNDVFEALGIPGAQLVSSFQHILNRFKENINKNSSSSSSRDVFDQRQFYVIFTALSLCMFGSPNNSLLGHAERLFEKEGDNDNDDDDDTRSQLTVGELLELERGLEYEFAAEFDFQDSRICVPMILPSLIALLQVDSMRSTVRVRLLMRLRSFFHSFENCDIFLTTPLWQSYVLNAIAMEQNRVLFLKEHLNKTREDLLGELHREIDEANNIVDIWTRLMCDLHLHCVQFGSPGVSSFALAKPRRSRMHDYYSLSTKDLLDIIRKDSRKLGCAGKNNSICCCCCEPYILPYCAAAAADDDVDDDDDVDHTAILIMMLMMMMMMFHSFTRLICLVVLRESLGILRTFSSNGILDDGKTIGVDLLSRTVEVIQREYNAVTTIAATMMMMQSPSELATRRKLLELNIWLVTFFALDFIVVPPAEISDRSSVKNIILSSILHSSDTTMFNAPNTPTFYKQLVATVPTHKQSPNPGKEPLMLDESIIPPSRTVSFSVDMLHEDYAAEETSDEVFGVEPGGTSDRFGVQTSSSSSSSSSTRKGRTRKLFLSSTLSSSSDDYHHHRRGPTAQEERPPTVSDLSSAGASNDQISPLRPIESCLPTASFSPDISRIDSSSSSQQQQQHYDYPLQNTTSLTVQEISVEEERYNAKVWKLVASLLTLLGPAGSSSWQALDRVDRLLKATVKAGYRQGRLLVTYITQESAEALLQQQQPAVVSMPPLTPLKVQSLSMSSALNRSVDGTFWIVLRVLLDVFIKSDSPTASTSAGDAMNDAGCKLIEMLEWLKEISKEFYDNECVYIAIKLIKAMRVSALRGVMMMGGGGGEGSSAWSKAASKLTVKLLTDQRTKILGRIEDLVQGCSPSDLEELFNTAATGGGGVTAVKSSVLSPRLYDRSDIDSFDDADYSSPYLSQSAVQELNLILDLINHCVAPPSTTQQQITWSVWDRVTEPIFIEASQAERDLVKSKLTDDFGSERDIEDSRKQLVEARRIEQKQSYMILSRLEELMSRVKAAEHGRLKDIAKAEDVKRRKCRSDWAAVYEELANERGAWGAALESAEVSPLMMMPHLVCIALSVFR